jgi:predicted metal-binding membrane protein
MAAAIHVRQTSRDRVVLAAALVGIAVVAWASLWAWERSPYATYLGHAGGAAPLPTEAAMFTVGWLLMIIAMMLPSSIPLVITFRALVGRRRHPGRLVGLLLLGYLVVWTAFGLGAWFLDRGVHAVVASVPLLMAQPQLILASTLLVAGAWQFSPWRDRCLDACRSPLGFLVGRWRGRDERREALAMGIAHGAFCVGCCWSLMLVMFGVGLGSLAIMLVVGGLTAVEKNLPWGRRLSRPLGVGMIVASLAVVSW